MTDAETWTAMMAENFGGELSLSEARRIARAPGVTDAELAAAAEVLAQSPHPDDRVIGANLTAKKNAQNMGMM